MKSWQNETGGNSDAATVATAGTATVGVSAKKVGEATTTTAAGVTAHRVLMCLRAPPRGQRLSNNRGSWPQLWRRQRRTEEWRERTFSGLRLVNLFRSSSSASTDHSELAMVAGKRCQEP